MSFSYGPYYAVHRGRNPGVYLKWEDCKEQVQGFSGNCYKKFSSIIFADWFVEEGPKKFKKRIRFHSKDWVSSGSEVEDCYYDDDLSDANDDREVYVCGKQFRKRRKNICDEANDCSHAPVCRYHLEGNCRFGRNCRFYHPPRSVITRMKSNSEGNRHQPNDASISNDENQKQSSNSVVNVNVNNYATSNSTTTCPGANQNASRKVCRYWSQGNCRFGTNCWFYHPAPAAISSSLQNNVTATNPSNQQSSNSVIVNSSVPAEQIYYDSSDSDDGDDYYGGNSFNYGMSFNDLNMLLSYGVKPWDDDADDLLDFLHEM